MLESIRLTKFAGLLRSGVSLEKSIEIIGGVEKTSKDISYLLEVARDSGASVSNEISVVAELMSVREKASQRITVAYASPKATARLVTLLPLITLALAQLVGWNVLGVVSEKPVVLISLALGVGLLLVSKFVSGQLIKRAKPTESSAGIYLLGVCLESSGGANLLQAQQRATEIHIQVFGYPPSAAELREMHEIEKLVQLTGAKVSELLLRNAGALQESEHVKAEIKIEKLGVRLMLPLGLGILPAFIFLAVVPLMMTTLG